MDRAERDALLAHVSVMELRKRADRSDERERSDERNTRHPKTGELKDPALREGDLLDPWPLLHVELYAGAAAPKVWEAPEDYVQQAISEGWAKMERDEITLLLEPSPITYKIEEPPGTYVDPSEPSGTRRSHAFLCRRKGVSLDG